jgi:RNA-splicing ligase RtcB
LEEAYGYVDGAGMTFNEFTAEVSDLARRLKIPAIKVFPSLGTLGGGNHFIEVDKDKDKCRWLLIHTGSRGFGAHVAFHYQDLATKRTHPDSPLKFLSGPAAEAYIRDMTTAQLYARVNRSLIAFQIGCDFFKVAHGKLKAVESIHNYIDFEHKIIRKGAISARKGEKTVIPFSMADGAILGVGKGNAEWNFSAPHGSGRKMSRTRAKELSVEEYRRQMKNVWSGCIGPETVDESPMAYKNTKDILDFIGETVQITHRLMPVYNFKASE